MVDSNFMRPTSVPTSTPVQIPLWSIVTWSKRRIASRNRVQILLSIVTNDSRPTGTTYAVQIPLVDSNESTEEEWRLLKIVQILISIVTPISQRERIPVTKFKFLYGR